VKRVALIGHRGVGKSSLLKRVEDYFKAQGQAILCLDLDSEIEKRVGQPIQQIFEMAGEAAFRDYERKTFFEIHQKIASEKNPVFLAMGAGFAVDSIPSEWTALWIRRSTDADGRIFLDRPRLNTKVSATIEFRERYDQRQSAFRKRADEILWLDEGLDRADSTEFRFFLDQFQNLGGAITLLPEQFRSMTHLREWVNRRVRWGVDWFELRDDLLTGAQMESALQILPKEKTLVSARDLKRLTHTSALIGRHALPFDWPLELGACAFGQPRFLSLHDRREGETITESLQRFPSTQTPGTCFKAALPTHGFNDLMEGHAWQQADLEGRAFLPMSSDGRWSWYRLHQSPISGLCFFRESDGTSKDQPTLLQWARLRSLKVAPDTADALKFAAVLGDPVIHSRTPLEQGPFFTSHGAPVFAIRVSVYDWRDGALEILRAMGLRWAAVTAPLKELAFAACTELIEPSDMLGAVNTLDRRLSEWRGANTDLKGFSAAVSEAEKRGPLGEIAVWGGGGTLSVIGFVLPKCEFFSLRSEENRNPKGPPAKDFKPDTVVWAGGGTVDDSKGPPASWKPKLVLDLSYKEDSPGRAYAQQIGCHYISGLAMFREQAEAQRAFWKTGI
jgi:shikimate 5-dehydrogenase/shikimate kinase